jgi:hypothetical protein
MTMLNLFPAIATNPVAVVASSSSSSKKNDNQLKFSIKDHFNDTKTVRRRGSSRTRKQQPVEPIIDESFADDSTVAVEDDSTFAPSAAGGIVATTDNDEIITSLMATTTNDKKFNTTEKVTIDESSNTAAAAVPSAPKMSSPNLPLYAQQQTTMLPPSILRHQTHHAVVPVSPMAYNNMPPPPHPAYNYYNCYDYSCNYAGGSTRGGGHPDINNVEVHSSSGSTSLGGGTGASGGCDYSYCSGMDSSSYCTTPSLLLTEPCEGFAKLVLRTVDTFASSVVRVMDYGEELCDSSGNNNYNNNNNNNNSSSSSIGTGGSRSTMSNEYVDLLAKIERLQKMVTDKESVFVATEKEENGVMTPSTPNGTSTTKQLMLINDLTESPISTTMKDEEDETRNNHLTINDTKTMDNPPSTINEDRVAVTSSIPRSSSSSTSNVPVVQITSSQDWSVMNESLTVLNESIETDLDDFQDVVVGDDSKEQTLVGEDDSVLVNELTSSFFNNDTTMTTSNLYSKSMEVDKQTEEESKQQLVNHRSKGSSKLKKFFNPKLSLVNKGDNSKYSTLLDDQPAVDSMGFPLDDKFASPLPKGSDNALTLWGSDFNSSISSSSNLFRRVSSIGSAESSPVSVATTLESCANCGLDGKSVYQSKKKNLMICSQCQSTYYCSSECQSEDWSNGHFKTCQPFAKAAAAVNEVLL